MTEIDYNRLDAIEAALGGREAVDAAYQAGTPIVGGGGGGGGGITWVFYDEVAGTFAVRPTEPNVVIGSSDSSLGISLSDLPSSTMAAIVPGSVGGGTFVQFAPTAPPAPPTPAPTIVVSLGDGGVVPAGQSVVMSTQNVAKDPTALKYLWLVGVGDIPVVNNNGGPSLLSQAPALKVTMTIASLHQSFVVPFGQPFPDNPMTETMGAYGFYYASIVASDAMTVTVTNGEAFDVGFSGGSMLLLPLH